MISLHHARDSLPCLSGVDAGQLLQIQLGDQGPMYFCFEVLQIHCSTLYLPSRIARVGPYVRPKMLNFFFFASTVGEYPGAPPAICRMA